MKSGIVILSELRGPVRERVLEIQRRFDPKLARLGNPHVTLTGSSGVGHIATRTTVKALKDALEPIATATPPLTLKFLKPHKFMQRDIVVLPLDPNGPLRALHDRIKRSGLEFSTERFMFTPHVTLSFFRELSKDEVKELLAIRVVEPVIVDSIAAFRMTGIEDSRKVLELSLGR